MRGLGETVVIRHDPIEIVTELQRGGEVQLRPAPQRSVRISAARSNV